MSSNEISKSGSNLFGRITELLSEARQFVVASVNHAMVYSKSQTLSANSETEKYATLLHKSKNPFKLSWSHYLQL